MSIISHLKIIILCIPSRLKSKNLYFNLVSSGYFCSPKTGIGKSLAADSTANEETVISKIDDYSSLVKELKTNKGATSIKLRKFMSAKAFS